MRKVRAGLVMTLVAGLLLLGGSRAQAVIGIPDDVPASTLLYPFFKVDPTPSASTRQDTLLVITNTANPAANIAAGTLASGTAHTFVHVTIWSVKSQHIYDFTVRLTEHDVWSCSLLDLLLNPGRIARPCGVNQAPTGVVTQLTVGDLLAGYVTADVVAGPTALFPGQAGYSFLDWNTLVGHLYLVDLPAGSATGFNAVSIESQAPVIGHPAVELDQASQRAFYLNRCLELQGGTNAACGPLGTYGNRERIDGPSGDTAQTVAPPVFPLAVDSPLSLIIRYFSLDEISGRSEVWLWKDRNTPGKQLDLAVYDEEEIFHSVSFSVPDEVNFTETEDIITPGAPGGWFRIRFEAGPFNYNLYNPADSTTFSSSAGALLTPIQAVAYSLQFAQSSNASLRWDAAFPAHRQYTFYIDGVAAE